MLDQSVTMEFPSLEALKNYRSSLHNARKRVRESSILLGFGDVEDRPDFQLSCKINGLKATFSLIVPKPKHTYTIISIQDNKKESEGDGSETA